MKSFLEYCRKEEDFTSITFHETCDDNDELFCFACTDLVIGGPAYILERQKRDDHDRDYLHKSCAELPGEVQHPFHPHPLTVRLCRRRYGFICDGCRHVSFGVKYRCKECKFKLDFRCVSENEGQALKERVEMDTTYHPHNKLQLVYFHSPMPTRLSKDIVCCCCLKSCPDGRDPTYTCNVCTKSEYPFFIHKSCLDTVPRKVQSSFHPEHPLSIERLQNTYICVVCDGGITGVALTCDKCYIKFHVSCGSRTTRGLRVLNLHQHDMHYVIFKSRYTNSCTICKADCRGAFYRCVKCRVNVHMECIPLPVIVEHESHDDHPLKLTDSVVTHRKSDEYRCDICEEEGNIKHHSYYCKECNYIAHIECVHSVSEISCLDPRGKSRAKEETEDAKEETDDEVYETDSSFQYDESDVDDRIKKFRTKIEELALQLDAVANLDKRIENVKADMVELVFQLEYLREKFIESRD